MSKPFSKSTILFFVCLIFTSPIFVTCEKNGQDPNIKSESYLRIADYIPYSSLNPLFAIHGSAVSLLELLYDTLIRVDEDGDILPHLAESWTVSENLKHWQFNLRKGTLFHDGTELIASDVVYTFNVVKEHGHPFFSSGYAKSIELIRPIDEYSLEFVLSEPMSTFLSFINMIGIFSASKQGNKSLLSPDFQPAGTGPYALLRLDGKEAVFERNDNYFLGKPTLNSIVVRFLPDQETIWARLMREEVDIFDFFGPESYHILTQIPSYRTFSKLRPYYCMMILNCADPRFSDIRVRRALNLAVNKERIVKKNLEGYGRICSSTVYPGHWSFDETLEPYSYDPKRALDLLGEAGWTLDSDTNRLTRKSDPFEIVLIINAEEPLMPENARSIERDLEAIGITIKTIALPPEDLFGRLGKSAFDATILNVCSGIAPDLSFTFWHSSSDQEIFRCSYENSKVNRLLTAGRGTIDRREQTEIYRQFQQVIHDDPPGVFLYWMEYLIAVHERFDNVNVKMVSGTYFRDISNWTVRTEASP